MALFSVAGMGHGTAVHPGTGVDACGSTGAFFQPGHGPVEQFVVHTLRQTGPDFWVIADGQC